MAADEGATAAAGEPWLVRRALLWLLPLAAAVKLAFVLSLADVFQYGEELEKGGAAKAMLDGLGVPHHQLAYHYYEGGGFVASHLKALAFLVVGESLWAHKLVALGFVLAILAAGYVLVRRLFGARAALGFGLLYVFAPASYQKLGLISLGIHFEACLFVLLVLGLAARLVFEREERARTWLVLGLATGFGLYFSYQLAVVAAYAAAWLAVARPRAVFGKGGALGLAGFALGALPLWIMFALVGERVVDIHGTSLAGAEELDRVGRALGFLRSIYVDRPPLALVGPLVWPLAFVAATVAGLAARGAGARAFRARFAYVLGYALLFLAVYLTSNFVVGEVRHFFQLLRLAPLWVAYTVLLAAASARLEEGGARILGRVLLFTPLAVGVASSAAIVLEGRPSRPAANHELLARTKGYLYAPYLAKLLPHLDGDDEAKLRALLRFDEPAGAWLRADIASELFRDPTPDWQSALGRALKLVEAVEPERRADYEAGLAPLLLIGAGWSLEQALADAAQAPDPLRGRLIEGLGRIGAFGHPTPENLTRDLALGLASADPAAFARGAGWRLYTGTRFRPDRAQEFLEGLAREREPEVREGYGAAVEAHWLPE